MRTFLSSIFSFSTPSFSDAKGSASFRTLAMVACLVAMGEMTARAALDPIGDYWAYWTPAAAAKFEDYRSHVRHGSAPHVLVVGDSTAARDLDPAPLAEATRATAFNLAWPANFPLAFRLCTLPLLRSHSRPDLVVASFVPTGFLDSSSARRFEESILESTYCRRERDQISASDYSYLARIRPALAFRRSWWTGTSLPQVKDLGFMPLDGNEVASDIPTVIPSVDPQITLMIAPQRFAAIEDLYRTARRFEFAVIVLVPPRRRPGPVIRRLEDDYIARLQACGFDYVDYREPSFLNDGDYYDRNHLNTHGAALLSRVVAADIAQRRMKRFRDAGTPHRCIGAGSAAE